VRVSCHDTERPAPSRVLAPLGQGFRLLSRDDRSLHPYTHLKDASWATVADVCKIFQSTLWTSVDLSFSPSAHAGLFRPAQTSTRPHCAKSESSSCSCCNDLYIASTVKLFRVCAVGSVKTQKGRRRRPNLACKKVNWLARNHIQIITIFYGIKVQITLSSPYLSVHVHVLCHRRMNPAALAAAVSACREMEALGIWIEKALYRYHVRRQTLTWPFGLVSSCESGGPRV